MIALVSFSAVAAQRPAVQQAGTAHQLVIGGQDVITASDAGGGHLSTRDLIILIALGVGVLLLIALL
jgi:hypothetical protein